MKFIQHVVVLEVTSYNNTKCLTAISYNSVTPGESRNSS